MIIGIDGNEANVEKRVGVSEFAYELLSQFSNHQSLLNLDNLSGLKYQVYLKSKPDYQMPKESDNFKYLIFGPKKLWTQWRLPLSLYLNRPRPDVFFTPSHYAPRFSPVPTVVSVMDLSYIHYPELFNKSDLYQLRNWTDYSVKNSKAVITISQSSKNDIIKLYRKDPNQVHVVYPGVKSVSDLEPHIYAMNELQNKYHISGNFLLFVGTLQPRKNIERLIEAYSRIMHQSESGSDIQKMAKSPARRQAGVRHDIDLVIIGKKGWQYESIFSAPNRFGVEGKVKFLDFVPNEDLALFYKNAICMVWPSLYEGFGLPVLEAMSYGCPVITSDLSSLPEAGGEAALYVNPLDVEDITRKIIQLLDDNSLRNRLIEKGKIQVKKFSWEKAANETIGILGKVAGNER